MLALAHAEVIHAGKSYVITGWTIPNNFTLYEVTVANENVNDALILAFDHMNPNSTDPISLSVAGYTQPKEYFVPYSSGDCVHHSMTDSAMPLLHSEFPDNSTERKYVIALFAAKQLPYRLNVTLQRIRLSVGEVRDVTISTQGSTYLFWDYEHTEDLYLRSAVVRVELEAIDEPQFISTAKMQVNDVSFLNWDPEGMYLSPNTAYETFNRYGAIIYNPDALSFGSHRMFLKLQAHNKPQEDCVHHRTRFRVVVKVETREHDVWFPVVISIVTYTALLVGLTFFGPGQVREIERKSALETKNRLLNAHKAITSRVSFSRVRVFGAADRPVDTAASDGSPKVLDLPLTIPISFRGLLLGNAMLFLTFVIFYSVPAYQLVWVLHGFYRDGAQDACFYNTRCMWNLGPIAAFNNVFSNFSFIVAGLAFLAVAGYKYYNDVTAAQIRAARVSDGNSKHAKADYNIYSRYILYSVLGLSILMEGLMSVCSISARRQQITSSIQPSCS